MDTSILRVMGQVAGLGGLALGFALIIFREVIRKNIFPNLTKSQSYRLLRLIVILSWSVALIGIAVWGFITLANTQQQLASNLKSIDSSLDPQDSPYEQLGEATEAAILKTPKMTMIGPKKAVYENGLSIEVDERPYRFPTIDFKFQNVGNATAFLWKFAIEVLHAEVDLTPVFEFSTEAHAGGITIRTTNHGWGTAQNCQLQIIESTLNKLYPARSFVNYIESGVSRTILKIRDRSALDSEAIKALTSRFTRLDPDRYRFAVKRSSAWRLPIRDLNSAPTLVVQEERAPTHGIVLKPIRALWTCRDKNGNQHNGEEWVRVSGGDRLIFTERGFVTAEVPSNDQSASEAESDITYAVIIEPLDGKHQRAYPVSRKILPGDVERFHILVGAKRSCDITVRFRFYVDDTQIVESEEFRMRIWVPRNAWFANEYADGEQIARDIIELERKLQGLAEDSWIKKRYNRKLQMLKQKGATFPFEQ